MSDLTDWLAEVHAADERAAHEASGRAAEWHIEEGRAETWDSPHRDPSIIAGGKPILTEDVEYSRHFAVEHVARHDPQSVLARIEAERMLVALHVPVTALVEAPFIPGHDIYIPPREVTRCSACSSWPCPTLRALAWGYRHRDGWQAQWAPEGVEVGA